MEIESKGILTNRVNDLLNRLTLDDIFPHALGKSYSMITDRNRDYYKLRIVRRMMPIATVQNSNKDSHVVELAMRITTSQAFFYHTSPARRSKIHFRSYSDSMPLQTLPTSTGKIPSSSWLNQYCKKTESTILVWHYNESGDTLEPYFVLNFFETTSIVSHHGRIKDHLKWLQAQIQNRKLFFFVVYDEDKCIDILDIQINTLQTIHPLAILRALKTSNPNKFHVLEQRYLLQFSYDEIPPRPIHENSIAHIYCRRLADYKVALLGSIVKSQNSCWLYDRKFYTDTLWSDLSQGNSTVLFQLVFAKTTVQTINKPLLLVMGLLEQGKQSTLCLIPLAELVPLITAPDLLLLTLSVQTNTLKKLNGIQLVFVEERNKV